MGLNVWDGSKYLKTKTDAREVLRYVLEEGAYPEVIASTLADIAKARGGVTKLAKETGLTRMTLYKIINGETTPSLPTLQKILKAFGLKIIIV